MRCLRGASAGIAGRRAERSTVATAVPRGLPRRRRPACAPRRRAAMAGRGGVALPAGAALCCKKRPACAGGAARGRAGARPARARQDVRGLPPTDGPRRRSRRAAAGTCRRLRRATATQRRGRTARAGATRRRRRRPQPRPAVASAARAVFRHPHLHRPSPVVRRSLARPHCYIDAYAFASMGGRAGTILAVPKREDRPRGKLRSCNVAHAVRAGRPPRRRPAQGCRAHEPRTDRRRRPRHGTRHGGADRDGEVHRRHRPHAARRQAPARPAAARHRAARPRTARRQRHGPVRRAAAHRPLGDRPHHRPRQPGDLGRRAAPGRGRLPHQAAQRRRSCRASCRASCRRRCGPPSWARSRPSGRGAAASATCGAARRRSAASTTRSPASPAPR